MLLPSWPRLPDWEDGEFNPLDDVYHRRIGRRWVDYRGRAREPPAHVVSAECMAKGANILHALDSLAFPDPEVFIAGGLHGRLKQWQAIVSNSEEGKQVLGWVSEGIDVRKFFRPFKGNFKGRHYDCDIPPKMSFPNANSCRDFVGLIEATIGERLKNGSIKVWGQVGQSEPPRVVMPLVVEPSKPRVCLDARFVNLWIVDSPFTLDTLKEVPRMVPRGGYMTSTDEKSGYDHISLSDESTEFMGFRWGKFYYVFTTIPFRLESYSVYLPPGGQHGISVR